VAATPASVREIAVIANDCGGLREAG